MLSIGPLLLVLGLVTLAVALALALELARGHRALVRLRDVAPVPAPDGPRVSVIIAARDEADAIEPALRSVIGQDYPDLEIVVVDDRSTDGTGSIIDRLAEERPDRVIPLHVERLPSGWLGKVHALHVGAERADGSILLFTDADVELAPTAVGRAVRHLNERGLHHLTVASRMIAPGPLLDLAVGSFILGATRVGLPWRCADPESDRYTGLGAFNMVRAETYRAIGGHEPIRMKPVDDLELGHRIKAAGHRQEMLLGDGMVSVEWYGSTLELIRGLRKNAFAGVGYRILPVVAITLFGLALDVWPWLALGLLEGPARWANGAIVLANLLSYADTAPRYGLNPWLAPFHPVGALILLYTGWASTVRTLIAGGIEWRGTHYPLDELKSSAEPSEAAENPGR